MLIRPPLWKATSRGDRFMQKEVRRIAFAVTAYSSKHQMASELVFTCHSVALAFSLMFPNLKLANGVLIGIKWVKRAGKVRSQLTYCEHSWLVTSSGAIIDAYPVGLMTIDPILVVSKGNHKYYGGTSYYQDETIKFCISRAEIRKKAYALLRVMRKAEKYVQSI
mgnify:CR=1 FL=1